MLKLPQIKQYGDFATVFPDSDNDFTFYVIPNIPRLRWENGLPVFLFLKYREAVHSDGADPTSLGGGYVQFDCELTLLKAQQDQVVADLQDMVNRNYRARGAATPPKVVISSPTWHDSDKVAVSLVTLPVKPDGSSFITNIAGAGKPSLLGALNTTFGMELTQRGAAALWQAFQMPTLPIAVDYHLEFYAQLPALKMHVWVDSGQVHHFHQEIEKDIDSSIWGDTDQSYTDTMKETFTKWNVGGVTVTSFDPGAVDPNFAKLKQDMEEQGWSMLQQQIQQNMKDKFAATPDAQRGAQGDYKSTIRDYIESFTDTLDVTFNEKSTVPWPTEIKGSMTLLTQQTGPNGEHPDLSKMFQEISLDDPFFSLLQVKVYCNCDFDNDPIDSVIVDITYNGKTQSFDFRAGSATPLHTYRTYRDKTVGDTYAYKYTVHYKGTDKVLVSPTLNSKSNILEVDVKSMGYLKVDVAAGAINWSFVDSVQVRLRYGDAASGVDTAASTLVLKPDAPLQSYKRLIYAVAHAYDYAVDLFFKNGNRNAGSWQSSSQNTLYVNDVFTDTLAVRLVPVGDWSAIQRVDVDLDYADPAHSYEVQNTLELNGTDTLPWLVPVWDGGPKSFRYRQLIAYKDGHTMQGDWTPQSGNQTLAIGEIWAKFLTVTCITDLLDWSAVKLVKVTLHYADPANAIDASEDFIFTSARPTAKPWTWGVKNAGLTHYDATVTYYLPAGSHSTVTLSDQSGDEFVVPMPAA